MSPHLSSSSIKITQLVTLLCFDRLALYFCCILLTVPKRCRWRGAAVGRSHNCWHLSHAAKRSVLCAKLSKRPQSGELCSTPVATFLVKLAAH